jgi:hypothetical protein
MSKLRETVPLLFLALLLFSSHAAAAKKERTQVELNVKPPGAQVFIDGKAVGKASAGRVVDVTPGFHVIRLVYKRDEHEERIKFPANQKTTYTFEFEEEAPAPDAVPSPVPDDDSIRRRGPSTEGSTAPAKAADPPSP